MQNKRKLPEGIVPAVPTEVKAQCVAVADGICINAAEVTTPPRKIAPKGSPADAFLQLTPIHIDQAVEVSST
jgi:hypothetical protein